MKTSVLHVHTHDDHVTFSLTGAGPGNGVVKAQREVDLGALPADLLGRVFRGEALGDFIAEALLGASLVERLAATPGPLVVEHPVRDLLGAALARVPWEQARAGEQTLAQAGVQLRWSESEPVTEPVVVEPDGALRLLLVQADPPGSRPLAARAQRRALLRTLAEDLGRQVEVTVLSGSVTRDRLVATWSQGFDVLHIIGPAPHDLIELAGVTGAPDRLTGEQLAAALRQAGPLPALVVLTATLPGPFRHIRDAQTLLAALAPTPDPSVVRSLQEATQPAAGFVNTGLGLVRAGVSQVVASRLPVEEAGLGALYAGLLGGTPDHAPHRLVIGAGAVQLHVPSGTSAWRPHPRPVDVGTELVALRTFVGRDLELGRLASAWLPPADGPALALIQGLPGVGKTALLAEALDLWHGHFPVVLTFSPTPASADAFLRRAHALLHARSERYRAQCEAGRPVWVPPSDELERGERLRQHLVEALLEEPVLIVLDAVEHLLHTEDVSGPVPTAASAAAHPALDPEWDRLLVALSQGLPGSGSRVLIASRRRPVSLVDPSGCLWLPLGPLPANEAAPLLLQSAAARKLAMGSATDQHLALRALTAGRGHPLLLRVLAALASKPADLHGALQRLEGEAPRWLPDVFLGPTSQREWEAEHGWLAQAVELLLDAAIATRPLDARRILWALSCVTEPVTAGLLDSVVQTSDPDLEQVRSLKAFLDALPPEMRGSFPGLSPEMQAVLGHVDAQGAKARAAELALKDLVAAGLVRRFGRAGSTLWSCGPAVGERIEAWAEAHPADFGEQGTVSLHAALAEYYSGAFNAANQEGGDPTQAIEAGRRAATYMVRAGDYERLQGFLASVAQGARDPGVPARLAQEVDALADDFPSPRDRASLRLMCADALVARRPDAAEALYAAAALDSDDLRARALDGLGRCRRALGQPDESVRAFREAAAAWRRVDAPLARRLAPDVEALRVLIAQGKAAEVLWELDEICAALGAVFDQGAPEGVAIDGELIRVFTQALEARRQAHQALQRWEDVLADLDRIEQVGRAEGRDPDKLAALALHRYGPLVQLGRLSVAQDTLERAREAFAQAANTTGAAHAAGALADLAFRQRDLDGAITYAREALAAYDALDRPMDRAAGHATLAAYLVAAGQRDEALAHTVAELSYTLLVGQRDRLGHAASRLGDLLRAGPVTLPPVEQVITRPGFVALQTALSDSKVNLAQLQTTLDGFIQQVRAGG